MNDFRILKTSDENKELGNLDRSGTNQQATFHRSAIKKKTIYDPPILDLLVASRRETNSTPFLSAYDIGLNVLKTSIKVTIKSFSWKAETSNMGFPSLLVLFLFLFFNVLSVSVGQENTDDLSAISFTLCEEFTGDVNFEITVTAKGKGGDKGKTLSTRFSGTTRQKNLEGKIDQTNVKHVKVTSTQEICFQALVVDTTIIIDQPTDFKASCPTDAVEDSLPCKEFNSRVKPVLICPQALTDLLKKKGVIENEPTQRPRPNSFETPTYDITNDMGQASLVIASGLTEEFNKVVKNRINVLSSAKKVNFGDIGTKLGSFSSFLSALGPMFSIFGGITTIITTFLTPTPLTKWSSIWKRSLTKCIDGFPTYKLTLRT
ncbi:hypothetical protein OS493_034513 [Desmophyllum pertusum]|uniref:Uncharacterized protein n=1 Tax=Desmophyllum pertusum TaxID=174260 RepID=A0A9W9YIN0_9CNID|nr:hypothetical protein OS493_034513 [Desmophyllum pertusum]